MTLKIKLQFSRELVSQGRNTAPKNYTCIKQSTNSKTKNKYKNRRL